MKALVVNALGQGFDLEDIDIAAPMGRESPPTAGATPISASGCSASWRRFRLDI
jgi:hypothetical protein